MNHVTIPKGGRLRYVPLTRRLAAALKEHRHLKSRRVLCSVEGNPLTQRLVQGLVGRAARRANLKHGGVHVLRHTFCSHLAMRGAPTRAIQELAGHQDLVTTQRYMHLSPSTQAAVLGSAVDGYIDHHPRIDGQAPCQEFERDVDDRDRRCGDGHRARDLSGVVAPS